MRLVLFICLITVFLFSCQKEVDPGVIGPGTGSNQLLVRVGTRSGADTFATDYAYNSNSKIIREYTFGIVNGQQFTAERTFIRNGAGIITKIILKSNQLAQLGLDSIVSNIKYNSSIARYSATVISFSLLGFDISDSTVYTYDGSGKLSREESFNTSGTGTYAPNDRTDYTYLANGNPATSKTYTFNPGTAKYELTIEYSFEYDSKLNPLKLGIDAIVFGNPGNDASNNIIKENFIDSTDPSNNETTNITYTYNTANKPITSIALMTPAGNNYSSTYTYK